MAQAGAVKPLLYHAPSRAYFSRQARSLSLMLCRASRFAWFAVCEGCGFVLPLLSVLWRVWYFMFETPLGLRRCEKLTQRRSAALVLFSLVLWLWYLVRLRATGVRLHVCFLQSGWWYVDRCISPIRIHRYLGTDLPLRLALCGPCHSLCGGFALNRCPSDAFCRALERSGGLPESEAVSSPLTPSRRGWDPPAHSRGIPTGGWKRAG